MTLQMKRNIILTPAYNVGLVKDLKYAENTWKILENGIHDIYDQKIIPCEELYGNAYNMVLQKFGDKLYYGLVSTMTLHIKQISASLEASQGPLFLEELNRKWMQHCKALQLIRNILLYMDRSYVLRTRKTPVLELGLNLWTDNIIHSTNIQTKLQHALLEIVQKERSGEVINRDLVRNAGKMLLDLGLSVYQQYFVQLFIDDSADFCRCESEWFIESCDCGEYLKKTEKCLDEEIERVAYYLDAKSQVKVANVIEKEMIGRKMNRLVHMEKSGLINMIMADNYDDLTRIYSLFRRVSNGLTLIRDVMSSYVKQTGKKLVWVKDPFEFVQRLVNEKDKHDKMLGQKEQTKPKSHKSFYKELTSILFSKKMSPTEEVKTDTDSSSH